MTSTTEVDEPNNLASKQGEPDAMITLQMGDKIFRTLESTLIEESHFFRSLLSGRWTTPKTPSNALLIDGDPEIFNYILRYLRRGTYPILYDQTRGFDYGLYRAILDEAKYFGVEKLCDWIQSKKFESAVKITYSWQTYEATSGNIDGNGSEPKTFQQTQMSRRVYQCPRGIAVHHGDPQRCGRVCNNTRETLGDSYERMIDVKYLQVTVVTTHTQFMDSTVE
ncbi:MAG: hypothetical protein M1814_001315 [Vezdaea aestivalis]|nr:MAG: hypothetical protein M1814_001315 [Vezdaea aestivalis]